MKTKILGFLTVGLLVVSGATSAAVVVYTDRSAWTAAVSGVTTETFNSFAKDTVVTSATPFPSGITVSPSIPAFTSDFAFGSIGQGMALFMPDAVTFALPGSPLAFGFDYADLEYARNVSFGTFSQSLALTGNADFDLSPDDFGFFGVVATAADIPGGTFYIDGLENFMIDNVSFASSTAVPLPAAAWLLLSGLGGLGLLARRKAN